MSEVDINKSGKVDFTGGLKHNYLLLLLLLLLLILYIYIYISY